jgi:hypothetical protein
VRARAIIALAAVGAALAPAASQRPWGRPGPPDPLQVRGALHVHGPFSDDARGGVDRIAREARQAGLDFVVITDHGRDAASAGYRDGVLVLVGMEKSTDSGHALVLGASPLAWRLDGEPETVVQDAAAQGGFVMAAHPGSSRPDSRWTAGCTGLAGLEVLNFAEPGAWPRGPALASVLLRYPFDPRGALLRALRPGREAIASWDACLAERPMAGWLGSDAHGGFPAGPLFVPVPSHRAIFRVGSNHLRLAEPRNGDAAHDSALVWRALREGRGYVALDGLADASRFRFEATSGDRRAGPGETLEAGAARLEAEAVAPPGTELVLLRDGREVARGPRIAEDVGPGVYRVEAYLEARRVPGRAPLPWILTNPIGVFPAAEASERAQRAVVLPPPATPPAPPTETQDFEDGRLARHWQVDRAPDASGSLRITEGALRWDFRLGEGARSYSSVADYRPRDLSRAAGVALRVRASERFRFDLQLRAQAGEEHRIWRRSVLAGPEWREAYVPFAALRTYDPRGGRPDLSRVVGVYFEVEAAHLPPGRAATLWIDDMGLVP